MRLESYESVEHQEMVRKLLDGRFENTAFCLLSPDGKTQLSRSGRAPWMSFSRVGPRIGDEELTDATVKAMTRIANRYRPKGDSGNPVVQDFHSFRQALNVASGDQRLLLYVATPEASQVGIRETLSEVMGQPSIVGRFHVDFMGKEDQNWANVIQGFNAKSKRGLFIIQSGQFGQDGKLVKQLSVDASADKIASALLAANKQFSKTEARKVYSNHVAEGRRKGIYFEGNVEYGEDRDGDGKIDHRAGFDRRRSPRKSP